MNKSDELLIDENNFKDYFKEVNKNKPSKGDIIACYRAKAQLIEGDLKKDIINLLKTKEGKNSAIKLLTKSAMCLYEDAVKISKNIQECLSKDQKEEDILKEEHPYTLEVFYYTKEDYVPKNDPHWSIIKIIN